MTVRRRRKLADEAQSPRGDSKQTELRVVGEPPNDSDDRLAAGPDEPEPEPEPEPETPPPPAVDKLSSDDDPFVDEVPATEPAPTHEKSAGTKWAMKVPMAWGNVVHDVFALDIDATYQRLTKELTLGGDLTLYASVLHALEASSRNAFDAARLVRAAKRADDDFAIDVDQRMEQLRSTARTELELEKDQQKKDKGVAKAPTLQEVSDRVLFNWPDEVRHLNRIKGEMHGALRSIEGLEKAWWDRCQTLRKIADRYTARS